MSSNEDIERLAAQWLLRSEEAAWTSSDEAGLRAWLDESLLHKATYWRLEKGWRAADRLVTLGAAPPPAFTAKRLQRRSLGAVAAGLALFAIGLLSWSPGSNAPPAPVVRSFATVTGQRELVALADGSRLDLNTQSLVHVAFRPDRREVWMSRGEIFFDVAHNPERPFVVHAADRLITVLGTQFSIRIDGRSVTVAVLRGRVQVTRDAEGNSAIATVSSGDIATSNGRTTVLAADSPAQVRDDLLWRDGMVHFDNATLADAAAEFNRYNRRQIVISDPSVSGLRLGGTFSTSNGDAFVRLLRDAYHLRVEQTPEQSIVSGP